MFDSRSDRPVFPGSHRAGHAFRHDCVEPGKGNLIAYGTPPRRILAMKAAERAAIAEGLADYAAEKAGDEPLDFHHLPGLGEIGWDRCVPEDGYRVGERVDDRTLAYDGRRKPRIAAPVDLEERGYAAGSIPLVGTTAKRRAAKRPFSRLSAPQFDPALVSRTLSPVSA